MTYSPIARACDPRPLPGLSRRHAYAVQRLAECVLDFPGVDPERCPWHDLSGEQVRALCDRMAERYPAQARVLLTTLRKLIADPAAAQLPANYRRPARTWRNECVP